jgi:hypothetical protein
MLKPAITPARLRPVELLREAVGALQVVLDGANSDGHGRKCKCSYCASARAGEYVADSLAGALESHLRLT